LQRGFTSLRGGGKQEKEGEKGKQGEGKVPIPTHLPHISLHGGYHSAQNYLIIFVALAIIDYLQGRASFTGKKKKKGGIMDVMLDETLQALPFPGQEDGKDKNKPITMPSCKCYFHLS